MEDGRARNGDRAIGRRILDILLKKMLAQQLRQLESDGIVLRTVYPQVPPRVDCQLTEWGQALCPALDALLNWAEQRSVG